MITTIMMTTTEPNGSTTRNVTVSEQAQRHVLRSFNPERDDDVKARVDATKVLCAGVIQQMLDLRNRPDATAAQKRGASIAITLIEGAQMAAVKANFAQE
jgi:Fe-S cluster assembly iron-binding protein IscA